MTTISASAATRVHRTAAAAPSAGRMSVHASMFLVGLLLAVIAVLVIDNHVMSLPDASFAEIGVTRSVLADASRGEVAIPTTGRVGSAAALPGSESSARSAHDLHRCFVRARRSGLDPAGCRVPDHSTRAVHG